VWYFDVDIHIKLFTFTPYTDNVLYYEGKVVSRNDRDGRFS
jgi:hypothetical protein